MQSTMELGLQTVLVFGLSLARILSLFVMIPFLSKEVLGSAWLRNGIAMNFALFIFPLVQASYHPQEWTLLALALVTLKEAVLGVLMGFLVSLLFWAIEAVGFFLDNQRGATMASSLNPLSGSQTSPIGVLLVQSLAVMFFSSGGFLLVLGLLYSSYQVWPVFAPLPTFSPAFVDFFIGLMDWLMYCTLVMAAPALIAMFLAEFGLALIGRFAPQLDVFFLAMPVKSAITMGILALYIGTLLLFFKEQLHLLGRPFMQLQAVLVP